MSTFIGVSGQGSTLAPGVYHRPGGVTAWIRSLTPIWGQVLQSHIIVTQDTTLIRDVKPETLSPFQI